MDTQLDQINPVSTGHSSTVTMSLHIGTESFAVLQASDSAIKLRDSSSIPRGDAILEITVDGQSDRWPIRVLPESPRPKWIAIADR